MFEWKKYGVNNVLYYCARNKEPERMGNVRAWYNYKTKNTTYHAYLGNSQRNMYEVGFSTDESLAKDLLEKRAREFVMERIQKEFEDSIKEK